MDHISYGLKLSCFCWQEARDR